ncbi:MAG TPA: UDP-N-acetylmuramoylalanyl-D-glutamyl-2,6-diaminopimelate--D-alanyl-D-alanine ligase [Stellaceae bacterium]|nr:UDP-N-acetylmuramoylalanyl-D-glutamyl-2,6-diaminopimelate--D-alanyl-D-alanine ligase [Stellaceae bacterium]
MTRSETVGVTAPAPRPAREAGEEAHGAAKNPPDRRAALWKAAEAAAATGGSTRGEWVAGGVSIDSRSVAEGDLFVALRGPNHDGHDYVGGALAAGAAAAMVDRDVPGLPASAPLLRVRDTLAGLTALGTAGRARSRARVIAVTGSVGKTGTKEALRLALAAVGTVSASAASFNNHWGVPLSLARMPPDAVFGVFELGMNHPGEIAPLSRLVRPHVAVITTIAPAHLGFFPSVEAIADAKAEIFLGLEPGGAAVLNRDNEHFPRLAAAAEAAGGQVIGFGRHPQATVRLVDCALDAAGSTVAAVIDGQELRYRIGTPGEHWVMNSLAVVAAGSAAGADVSVMAAALAGLEAPAGRGHRQELPWRGGRLTLIDESYNASPASVRAALSVLAMVQPAPGGRRIAVLGDMLELGGAAEGLHRDLAAPLFAAKVDRAFLVGSAMAALHTVLPEAVRGGHWPDVDEAVPALLDYLRPGDVVTVKGSHAGRIDRIVARLRAEAFRTDTSAPAPCHPDT